MDTLKKIASGYHRFLKKCPSSSILLFTYITLLTITLATVWYSVTTAVTKHLDQQTDVLGSSLATQAAFNATQSILTNDLLSLNVLLNRLVVSDNIVSARVFNKKDELLAEANRNGGQTATEAEMRASETHNVFSSPIRFRDDVVGHVFITLDKTSVNTTLVHISNLVIGLGIFLAAVTSIILWLVVRRLILPVVRASDAIEAFSNGTNKIPLPLHSYREANELLANVRQLQTLELKAPIVIEPEVVEKEEELPVDPEGQFEINFDQIIKDSERETCALFIQLKHLGDWQEALPPLQVANLLTPIYRSVFLASEFYNGQVHQFEKDCVVVLFQAKECKHSLYMNATCCAELTQGLLKQLMKESMYADVPKIVYHMGLHKGNDALIRMFEANEIRTEEISGLVKAADILSLTDEINKLVVSEEVVTVPEIQNRIIFGLPEVIESDEGEEMLAYSVKGLSDKYRQQVYDQLKELAPEAEESTDNEPEEPNKEVSESNVELTAKEKTDDPKEDQTNK